MMRPHPPAQSMLNGLCTILISFNNLYGICLLKEQIDLLASLLAGVAKNTDNIMAKQVATSSFGAQAKGGERLRPSTAVTEAPLAKSVSVTSIIPKGAAKCKGLQKIK